MMSQLCQPGFCYEARNVCEQCIPPTSSLICIPGKASCLSWSPWGCRDSPIVLLIGVVEVMECPVLHRIFWYSAAGLLFGHRSMVEPVRSRAVDLALTKITTLSMTVFPSAALSRRRPAKLEPERVE